MAGSRLLKVDRVASAAEAEALEAAGASVIGIGLATGRPDEPERSVGPEMARAIRDALQGALLCVTLDGDADDAETALGPVRTLAADMIQVPAHSTARDEWREAIEAEGLPVVLDGEEISYEDDPAFIEQRLSHDAEWTDPLFQVALLDDMTAPWAHLGTEAPQHPDDYIQLHDLQQATAAHGMLVTMDVSPEEVGALWASLPDSKGLYFRLGTDGIGPVVALLEAIRAAG